MKIFNINLAIVNKCLLNISILNRKEWFQSLEERRGSDSLGFSVIAWQLVVLSFGFELVTVGLEHSDDLELQGTDEENGDGPDDPDP